MGDWYEELPNHVLHPDPLDEEWWLKLCMYRQDIRAIVRDVELLHGNLFSGRPEVKTPKGHNLVIDYYIEYT